MLFQKYLFIYFLWFIFFEAIFLQFFSQLKLMVATLHRAIGQCTIFGLLGQDQSFNIHFLGLSVFSLSHRPLMCAK
ncbi:hypothetical protein F4703DRAFT_1892421 [Phycomyces blakesleeanus]